jgi:hypothetical protein
MKTKTKRIWQALALVVAFAVAVGLVWKSKSPPQIITLPNGERFQFIAAEWGTNWVQPTAAARFIARLPAPVAAYVYRKWGSRLGIVTPIDYSAFFWGSGPISPPEPALHFWFRSLSTNTFGATNNFKFMLADQNGVVAGQGNGGWSSFGQGPDKWLTFGFPVLPRRSPTLQLLVFKADDQFRGPYTQIGAIRFPNPLYGRFPQWHPEPLPVTKTNGDLTVQLTDFSIGSGNQGGNQIVEVAGRQTRFHPPERGEDQEIVFKLDIHSPRGTNAGWSIQPAELSDATGNHISTSFLSRWAITDEYHMGTVLWPDESAWRLKLTLRRFRGYDPEELVTFTNIPVPAVGATNTIFQTNLIHGVPVVLRQEFVRQPDMAPAEGGAEISATHIVVEMLNPPDGFVVGFDQLNTDTQWKPEEWGNRQKTNAAAIYLYSLPAEVRTLNLTWAVQKTRTVEFFVKPPKSK